MLCYILFENEREDEKLKKLTVLLILSLSASLGYTETNFANDKDDYIEILEAYIRSDSANLNNLIQTFLEDYPDSQYIDEVTEISNQFAVTKQSVTLALPDSVREKKSKNALFYYWVMNISQITGAMNMYPSALDLTDPEIYAVFNLVGIGAGVATSLMTTQSFQMNWGRALAIDLYAEMVTMHASALYLSLFTPDRMAEYQLYEDHLTADQIAGPVPINSFFPNTFAQDDFNQWSLAIIPTAMLAGRYAGIFSTSGEELSVDRYSLLTGGFHWATIISLLAIGEIDRRGIFSLFPNPHAPLIATLIGDGAVFLLGKYGDKLDWSAKKIWLTSLSGAVTTAIAPLIAFTSTHSWDSGHVGIYGMLYAISGLTLGHFATEDSSAGALAQISGYVWGAFITESFFSEINVDFSLKWLLAPVAGNVASYLIYKNFGQMKWTTGHTLLVDLGGVIGMIVGASIQSIISGAWIDDHYPVYNALWTIAGLASFALFTRNMPDRKSLV